LLRLYAHEKPKRSKLEIYLDVLHVIKRGEHKPTRIMYAANLSWSPLSKVLNSLIDQELIKENDDGERTRYEITEKGEIVLRYFEKTRELIMVA